MGTINIIYEKQFSRLTQEDYDQIVKEIRVTPNAYNQRNSEAVVKNLFEGLVYIVIPERMEKLGFFVAMAKEVAEQNEVDTVITECEDRYIATFYFDCSSTSFGLKELIEFGDDISIGSENGYAVVSIIYLTHNTYRSTKLSRLE